MSPTADITSYRPDDNSSVDMPVAFETLITSADNSCVLAFTCSAVPSSNVPTFAMELSSAAAFCTAAVVNAPIARVAAVAPAATATPTFFPTCPAFFKTEPIFPPAAFAAFSALSRAFPYDASNFPARRSVVLSVFAIFVPHSFLPCFVFLFYDSAYSKEKRIYLSKREVHNFVIRGA